MKKANKWLSALLSLVMVLSLLPVSVLAAEPPAGRQSLSPIYVNGEIIFADPESGPVNFTEASPATEGLKKVNVVVAKCEVDANGAPVDVLPFALDEDNHKITAGWADQYLNSSVDVDTNGRVFLGYDVFTESTTFATGYYYLGTYLVNHADYTSGKLNFDDYVDVKSLTVKEEFDRDSWLYSYTVLVTGTKYTNGRVERPVLDRLYSETLDGDEVLLDLYARKLDVDKPADITVTVDPDTSFTYNGEPQMPTVRVRKTVHGLFDGWLDKNTDYDVNYVPTSPNADGTCTNAGIYKVVVTGKGEYYTGTYEKDFIINRATVNDLRLDQPNWTYKGDFDACTPKSNTVTFVKGVDYELEYYKAEYAPTSLLSGTWQPIEGPFELEEMANKPAGDYLVKVDFTDTNISNLTFDTAHFTIEPAELGDGNVDLGDETTFVYDGDTKTPTVTVYSGDLKNGEGLEGVDYERFDPHDYTVNYYKSNGLGYTEVPNPTSIGTYYVTVTGQRNYTGSVTKSFEIVSDDLGYGYKVMLSNTNVTYNGDPQHPTVTVWKDGHPLDRLSQGDDYTVSYYTEYDAGNPDQGKTTTADGATVEGGDPANAGSYTVVINGRGMFVGSSKEVGIFTINPKPVRGLTVDQEDYVYGEYEYADYTLKSSNVDFDTAEYDGEITTKYYEARFVPTLGGGIWMRGAEVADITVADAGEYYVVVTVGDTTNYTGATASAHFTIDPVDIKDCDFTINPLTYNGADQQDDVVVTVTDLVLDQDYTLGGFYVKENYGLLDLRTRYVPVTDLTNAGTYYVKVNGMNPNYTGTEYVAVVIAAADINTFDVEVVEDDMVYDGHDWNDPVTGTPVVIVMCGENVITPENYTLTYSVGDAPTDEYKADTQLKAAGTYWVKVTGAAPNFTEDSFKKVSFEIAPATIDESYEITATPASLTANGSDQKSAITVTVTDGDGNELVAGYDYDPVYAVKNSDDTYTEVTECKNAGTYYVKATGKQNYTGYTAYAAFTIAPAYSGGGGGGGGAAVSTNKVNLPESLANGTVKSSHDSAAVGTTVTLTFAPAGGYKLGNFGVLDEKGNVLTLTDLGNGKYSFKMPASAVTVKATFAEADNAFVDVPEKEYYSDAVKWAVENGVTNGVDATHFNPNVGITRAQVVTFLWRAAGEPEVAGNANQFADVNADGYYAEAVAWAIEQGVTKGTSDTTFSPDVICTRGQIVTFLARFAGVKDTDTASAFADVKATEFFAAAVKWANDNGVTNGVTPTTFEPYTNCTRGQVVTFLYRWMVK